ncbi:hypothetical protein [Nodosilinea nodulosa]|uniref:hypothetical protein n=1 Tax=Nodosilinea nodulosa TaxID=416001 RepID=UPI0012D795F1|nr:hypothetical protein [Nodosilinea nodulosa]
MGAWLALRYALNPGAATGLVLATALLGLAPAAWGSELSDNTWAADALSNGGLSPGNLPGGDTLTSDRDTSRPGLPPEHDAARLAVGSPPAPTPLPLPKPGAAKPRPGLGLAQGRPLVSATGAEAPGTLPAGTPAPSQASDAAPTVLEPVAGNAAQSEQEVLPPAVPTPKPEATLAPAERSEVFAQAAYLQEGGEGSARLRVGGIYVLSPSVFVGATVDLSTGQAFSDTDQTGLSLSELYLTASPANLPELRLTVGLMDLTSYLDRNSFAKDSLTHFFNPVFQTNPALSTVNVASRPGALVNWTPVDALSLTATAFSSSRDLGSFAIDSFAGEVGVRFGNAIVRGTYVTSTDAGRRDGFDEIFAIDRGNGQFGPLPGDRETGFGLNAEAFIPGLRLGFFGRYGWYTNQTLGASGQTYSLGLNGLDVFMPGDRLGLGYGRQLSNSDLRQASGRPTPDVWELFYDAQVIDNLRAGVSVQQRNAFTETYLGFRLRYDLRWNPLRRAAE